MSMWLRLTRHLYRHRLKDGEYFDSPEKAAAFLNALWLPPPAYSGRVYYRRAGSERTKERRQAAPTRRPDSRRWNIALSGAFQKSVACIEKKLQGRVLEALVELVERPMEQRGDTIKPLDGELKGMWRYRIGNYRLLYRPDIAAQVVMLIDFSPRSEAYGGNN